jgi:hypothetical protein
MALPLLMRQAKTKGRVMKLLTVNGNPKIAKGDKQGQYLTAILHLSPANLSGFEVCPKRSEGCTASCLNTAGRGGIFKSIQDARKAKTLFFFNDRNGFLAQLKKEIAAFERKCAKLGVKPAVRLNGTSDIVWEQFDVIQAFPNVQFYDYTKIAARFRINWMLPKNYRLTFSLSENNQKDAEMVLENGGNVAAVFRTKEMPPAWLGARVVNGDATDLRFLDPSGVVVGLSAKGKAKKDQSGFVIDWQVSDMRKHWPKSLCFNQVLFAQN